LESRQVLKPESPVHPVLYKIIINNSLDIRKHDKVKRKHEQRFAQHEISRLDTDELERIEYRQLGEDIQKAIATLPEQMQKIFKLCKYEGLTYPKVAQQLNLSVKTVEKQMSRAFFKLRKSLSAYLE
jgi:RNA polymerase sigma-70 factor (ECF subfamily)